MNKTERVLIMSLLACTLHGCSAAQKSEEIKTVHTELIIASDLHYLSDELTDHGEYFENMIRTADGKAMNDCSKILDHFIDQVIAEHPEAVAFTGDLTFNGEKLSHTYLADAFRKIEDEGIEVLVIPGNHDIDYGGAACFEGDHYTLVENITADEFRTIYREYGYSDALSCDKASGSYVYQLASGLRLLFIDVNMTENDTMTVPEETLQWMEKQLKEAEKYGYPVVSFSHQNLMKHSIMESGYVIENAEDVKELLEKYNVPLHFSGHMHLQHVLAEGSVTECASGSLMISPYQYGCLEVDDNLYSYHTETVSLEGCLEETKDYFKLVSLRKTASQYGDSVTEDMLDYFAELNTAYFGGNLSEVEIRPDITMKWKGIGGFMYSYILSMEAEAGKDYTSFEIQKNGESQ